MFSFLQITFFADSNNTRLILRAHFVVPGFLSLIKNFQRLSFVFLAKSTDKKHLVKHKQVKKQRPFDPV